MPRTIRGEAVPRTNIRIPKPMMDAVQQVVDEHPELYNNRQQFCERAIAEKLEVYRRFGPS